MSAPRNKGNGKAINFLRGLVAHDGDACVTWPYAVDRHGYGHFGYMSKMKSAHRTICEMVNGPAPSPLHHASHSCGRGHEGCVNPRHLSWKSASENCLDRRRHGTQATNKTGGVAKLDEEQRQKVKELEGVMPRIHIATKFGVSRQTIKRILDGRRYRTPSTKPQHIKRRLETQRRVQQGTVT